MDGHVTWTTIALLLLVCVVSTTADESAPAVIKMVATEGDDAVLSCSFGSRSIKQELFDWKKDGQKEVFMYDRGAHYNNNPTNQDQDFRGRVFHFPQELDVGNASVVIRATKVTDSGSYTCDFPRHQPRRRSHIVLVVDLILKPRPDISGAAPEPYVKTLGETESGVQLQCSVKGASPKPVVHWQDRSGNIVPAEEPQVSERGGSYDIILQTTVTKTDHYQCVATQEEIKHTVYTETYVPVHDNRTGVIVFLVVLLVLLVVLVVLLVVYIKRKHKDANPPGKTDDENTPMKDDSASDCPEKRETSCLTFPASRQTC